MENRRRAQALPEADDLCQVTQLVGEALRLTQQNDEVVLAVENDGPVIQPTGNGFNGMGCRIMKYRAGMIGGALQLMALKSGGCLVTCSYRPANYRNANTFPSPAPAGPYSGKLSAFNRTPANGTWIP